MDEIYEREFAREEGDFYIYQPWLN